MMTATLDAQHASPVDHWHRRALEAERFLAMARAKLTPSRNRTAVLQVLGELKPCEWLATPEVLERAGLNDPVVLERMRECGLVVSRVAKRAGRYGRGPNQWQLAPLVVVPEGDE